MKTVIFTILLLTVSHLKAHADIVFFKDGTEISFNDVEISAGFVVCKNNQGRIFTFSADEVDRVKKELKPKGIITTPNNEIEKESFNPENCEIHLINGKLTNSKTCWCEDDNICYKKFGTIIKIPKCDVKKIVYVNGNDREELQIANTETCQDTGRQFSKKENIDDSLNSIANESKFRSKQYDRDGNNSGTRVGCLNICAIEYHNCKWNPNSVSKKHPGASRQSECEPALQACNNSCQNLGKP